MADVFVELADVGDGFWDNDLGMLSGLEIELTRGVDLCRDEIVPLGLASAIGDPFLKNFDLVSPLHYETAESEDIYYEKGRGKDEIDHLSARAERDEHREKKEK
jgi:hypothetical protein